MSRITALIFAKFPEPGLVKTRMVPPLSMEEASQLHLASLRVVVEKLHNAGSFDVQLVGTPDDRVRDLTELIPHDVTAIDADDPSIKPTWPQGGGDLGARLVRASTRAFDEGARGVVLLGADSPMLPEAMLCEAATRLRDHDAVLGPTEDGGYYLLGLSRPLDTLFHNIDWGSRQVARQTRARAKRENITLGELPRAYDLDRFEDLVRARHDLGNKKDLVHTAESELLELLETLVERHHHGRADSAHDRTISGEDGRS